MRIPLVVLAAGLSTRYGRLKQLEPLGPGSEAIMDYNVFDALRAGFGHVHFVVRAEIRDVVESHVHDVFRDEISCNFVSQSLQNLPDGFRAPADRRKPWGTAHAILSVAPQLAGPFAVCNADDLYGPGAFALLYEYLSLDPLPSDGVLVGYPLRDTVSAHGEVARGVCHVGEDALLEHVIEVRDIRRKDDWIVGVESDWGPVELTGDELVSMNLWGFTPTLVEGMRRRFTEFLGIWGAHTTREFFLSTAINAQVQVGRSRVRVLRARDPWHDLTHSEDQAPTKAALTERIESGVYPENLASGLPFFRTPRN